MQLAFAAHRDEIVGQGAFQEVHILVFCASGTALVLAISVCSSGLERLGRIARPLRKASHRIEKAEQSKRP